MLLAACGSGDGATDAVGDAIAIDANQEFELIFGDSGAEDPGLVEYAIQQEQALDERIRACLENAGLDYQPRTVDQIRGELEIAEPELTRERRELIGYGISITDDTSLASSARAPVYDDDVSDAVFSAGGCRERAAAVRTEIDQIAEQFYGEFSDTFEQYESHPEVIAAQAAWISCMAREGFDASSSSEMEEQIRELLADEASDLAQLQDFERRAAVADHDCHEETSAAADEVFDDMVRRFRDTAFVPFVEQVEELR